MEEGPLSPESWLKLGHQRVITWPLVDKLFPEATEESLQAKPES